RGKGGGGGGRASHAGAQCDGRHRRNTPALRAGRPRCRGGSTDEPWPPGSTAPQTGGRSRPSARPPPGGDPGAGTPPAPPRRRGGGKGAGPKTTERGTGGTPAAPKGRGAAARRGG